MRPLRLWQVNAHYTIMQSVGDHVTRPRLLAAMCLPRGGSANYSWQACLWRAESRGCKIEAPWGPWIWSSLDLDMVKPAPGYGQAWTWIWSALDMDMVSLGLDRVRPGLGYGQHGPGYGQPGPGYGQAWTWISSGLGQDMVKIHVAWQGRSLESFLQSSFLQLAGVTISMGCWPYPARIWATVTGYVPCAGWAQG